MSDVTIQELQIEIESNSTSASKGIDALASSLGRLRNATQGCTSSLGNLSRNLSKIKSSIAGINGGQVNTLTKNLRSLSNATKGATTSSQGLSSGWFNFAAKSGIAIFALRRLGSAINKCVGESNKYIEDLNLFNVSMGEYASEAQRYAEQVSGLMGIDPSQWMRNQGVFNLLATGFGVTSDKAALMSKNLTQLGYDISSLTNISVEDAMLKLQSGLAGELEPLRRIGYDLSVARLQQEAYNLGITKSVNAMTQAEKAQLRYYAIMTQVKQSHGDMARTINAPANQLRILRATVVQAARAIGNLFIPILQAILPVAIAVAKVIGFVASLIAGLLGIKIQIPKFDGIGTAAADTGKLADNAGNAGGGLGKAAKKAKELKNALLGIDELNIIEPPDSSAGGGGGGAGGGGGIGGGGGLDFDLPEYDFLGNGVKAKFDEIAEGMKKWLGIDKEINTWAEFFQTRLGKILETITAIGVGFAAWKVAQSVVNFIEKLESLGGKGNLASKLGFLLLGRDLMEFVRYLEDIIANGASLENVVGMLSSFTGAVGDCLLIMGKYDVAGALKVVQGIGEMLSGLASIARNGLNVDGVLTVIAGISDIMIGVGILNRNVKALGAGMALQGITTIIREISDNWQAIKEGDWSGVNKVALIIGAIEAIGGIVIALGYFTNIFQSVPAIEKAKAATDKVGETTKGISESVGSKLAPNLKSLAVNIGWGIAIMAELAVGAIIFLGAIYAMGKELEAIANAWTPVIEQGKTVAIAIVAGSMMMATVGLVTSQLGKLGATVFESIAVGAVVLTAVSLATVLFISAIAEVGNKLNEVGIAWSPVLSNGAAVAEGTALGIGIIAGFALIAFGIGSIVVGSGGTIAVAIGAGAAFLIAITKATTSFVNNLAKLATALCDNLAPKVSALNSKLPSLKNDMESFVDYMDDFASEVLRYTKATAIAGFSSAVNKFVQFFTGNPVKTLADEVGKVGTHVGELNRKLQTANVELETAVNMLSTYQSLLTRLSEFTGVEVNISAKMFINLQEVGSSLVTGFISGIKAHTAELGVAATDLVDTFNAGIEAGLPASRSVMTTWGQGVNTWFTVDGAVNRTSFNTYGNTVTDTFSGTIDSTYSSSQSPIMTWASAIHKWFTKDGEVNDTKFAKHAQTTITGFKDKINSSHSQTQQPMNTWGSDVNKWFSDKGFGKVNSTEFGTHAKNIITGFKESIDKNKSNSKSAMTTWASKVQEWFKGDKETGLKNKFYNIAGDVIDGFKNGINAFYTTARSAVSKWAADVIATFKKGIDSDSPSKVFIGIGKDTVLGYNIGVEKMVDTSKRIVASWAESITDMSPAMSVSVDTSALKYYNGSTFARDISSNISTNSTITATGFKEGMEEFYREYLEPTMVQMADDVRRQADKKEQTIVQIGNRTVTDAVSVQKKANGYSFVR